MRTFKKLANTFPYSCLILLFCERDYVGSLNKQVTGNYVGR